MFVDANENQEGFADDLNVSDTELAGVNLFKDIDPDAATPDQVKAIIKTGQTLLVQKKTWRDKALAAKPAAAAETINPKPVAEPDGLGSLQSDVAELKTEREKRQFGHANDLTPEETDEVFAYSHGAKLNPSEALKKPFVQSALESLRAQSRADGAIPGPSNRSTVVDGKPFSSLTKEEKAKNFPQMVKNLSRRR